MCSKYGVQGYPTLKYFSPSTSPDGDPYEDARDLKALNKFVKRAAKMPCVPDTGENCDKKDNAYLEDMRSCATGPVLVALRGLSSCFMFLRRSKRWRQTR